MRPTPGRRFALTFSFPRVSGDAPPIERERVAREMFSPRERGCALGVLLRGGRVRVFPA